MVGIPRGSTPTIRFKLHTDASAIDLLHISFAQFRKIVITRNLSDIEIDGEVISCKLTEEETLALTSNGILYVQVRAGINGDRPVTPIYQIEVLPILEGGLLDDIAK